MWIDHNVETLHLTNAFKRCMNRFLDNLVMPRQNCELLMEKKKWWKVEHLHSSTYKHFDWCDIEWKLRLKFTRDACWIIWITTRFESNRIFQLCIQHHWKLYQYLSFGNQSDVIFVYIRTFCDNNFRHFHYFWCTDSKWNRWFENT